MIRLFIAVNLSPDALRGCGEQGRRVEEALGDRARAVRFSRPEGLHFTLKFLGWCPEDSVEPIRQALVRAADGAAPFDLELGGFEAFPNPRRPRVVYVGVRAGAPQMSALAARVEEQVAPLGHPTEARGFTPHVTLLRVKDPKAAALIGERVAALTAGEPIRMRVEHVDLMRSELSPGGSRYTSLAQCALGA